MELIAPIFEEVPDLVNYKDYYSPDKRGCPDDELSSQVPVVLPLLDTVNPNLVGIQLFTELSHLGS